MGDGEVIYGGAVVIYGAVRGGDTKMPATTSNKRPDQSFLGVSNMAVAHEGRFFGADVQIGAVVGRQIDDPFQ